MDRLKDRPLGAREDIGDRRGQQRARIRLHGGDDIGADQRRRNLLVAAPGRVGVEVGERRRVRRPIPDDIVVAPARPEIAVARRHRIGHHEFAAGNTERIALEQERAVGDDIRLGGEPAPGDVARISGLEVGKDLRPDRGTRAVGGDQQIARCPRAVGKNRRDAVLVLLCGNKRLGRMIVLRRECVLERPIEPRPCGHDAGIFELAGDPSARIEQDVPGRIDAERGLAVDPDPAHHLDKRLVRAEPGAAPCKVLGAALEHVDAPAALAQQMRREHSAERAADDQRMPTHDAGLQE